MVIIYVDKLIKVSRQQRCNTANIFGPPFFICFSDSRWTLDGLPDEEYLLWEAEAIRVHEQAKAKQHKRLNIKLTKHRRPYKQQVLQSNFSTKQQANK